MIVFDIGHSGQRLSFDDAVLSHFDRHRQTRFWHREAGGLLFARLSLPKVDVCAITGPRRTDHRNRYSYAPDEHAEQCEINEMFRRGHHFVGCWHTHPEDAPSPSQIDTRNISDCVRRSKHALNGFVMVIVGRSTLPKSLFVSICDQSSVYRLTQASSYQRATITASH